MAKCFYCFHQAVFSIITFDWAPHWLVVHSTGINSLPFFCRGASKEVPYAVKPSLASSWPYLVSIDSMYEIMMQYNFALWECFMNCCPLLKGAVLGHNTANKAINLQRCCVLFLLSFRWMGWIHSGVIAQNLLIKIYCNHTTHERVVCTFVKYKNSCSKWNVHW